jgi:hypothetical protein
MKTICLFFAALLFSSVTSAREYHVSVKGSDTNEGSAEKPFRTISHSVQFALPGDTITVHAGVYREWVNPLRGGESDSSRILYRAAPGEKAEIKGSEVIRGWVKEKNGVWKVVIPNSFFRDYNPYRDSIYGDWFNGMGRIHHTGEVFLNGRSLFEKETMDQVLRPTMNKGIRDTIGSMYTWYCESDAKNTTLWANFHRYDPNRELVEITTRRTCFYPDSPYINYLTIRGFHISQAATQWAAPTAEQVGMISTHWNKGWIIENNIISDSKCNGITLGKERGTGHNVWSADSANVNRDGNIHYIEVIFRALRNNWDREHNGSHVVRNNEIFNCEQTGICGSMGAIFSTIENNHIYNIWTKRQFTGAEIAGIKFHAPVDATIRKNRVHDCGRGIWLDWMTQGTRVSANLLYNNDLEDIFIEVDHGPFMIDNNILLSPRAISTMSEGGAYLHNLIAGAIVEWPEPNRFTPYFLPHSTSIAGLTTIMGGDDRYYNNVFIGPGKATGNNGNYGLVGYNGVTLPVSMEGNVYYHRAQPSEYDEDYVLSADFDPQLWLEEKDHGIFLHLDLDSAFFNHTVKMITTVQLGKARIPKAAFEDPDGSPIQFNEDYFGKRYPPGTIFAGPFANLNTPSVVLRVW